MIMNNTTSQNSTRLRRMCAMALFCALAYACVLVLPPFKFQFLSFDAKDAIIAIGALSFGPISGVVISLIVSFLEMITISNTGFYGFIMNFLSSAAFSAVAALVYRRYRKLGAAVVGLVVGIFSMTAVMMVANLLITPRFMGAPRAEVAAMIPTVLLPFNLTKSTFNAGLALLLYKPITQAMTVTHLLPAGEKAKLDVKKTIFVSLAALGVIAACVLVFILVLGGKIQY